MNIKWLSEFKISERNTDVFVNNQIGRNSTKRKYLYVRRYDCIFLLSDKFIYVHILHNDKQVNKVYSPVNVSFVFTY